MRTPHYEHDSRIIEPRKCGKDRVRERPDQGNRIERLLHRGRQIICIDVLALQFFPCHCLAPAWSDEGKPSRAARAWTMFHKFVTQIRDQPRVVPGARAIHTGCRCSRSSLWVINSSTASLYLNVSR